MIWNEPEAALLGVLITSAETGTGTDAALTVACRRLRRVSRRNLSRAFAVLADPQRAGVLRRLRVGDAARYHVLLDRLAFWKGKERPAMWDAPPTSRTQLSGACSTMNEPRHKNLALVDHTEHTPMANAKALAFVEPNREVLRAFAGWALEHGMSPDTSVLVCLAIESWDWLAEALMANAELDALRASAASSGRLAIASGIQPRDRLASLFLDRLGIDLGPMLCEPIPPNTWRVLICFDGGMGLGGLSAPTVLAEEGAPS